MKKSIYSTRSGNKLLASVALMVATTVAWAVDTPSADGYAVSGSPSGVTVSSAGTAVTISFEAQAMPASYALRGDLLVGGANPTSVFNGDLAGSGYSGIRFKITGSGARPAEANVRMRIIDQDDPLKYHDWYYAGVVVSSKPGEWTITDIPLGRSAGWTTARAYKLTLAKLDTLWTNDLSKVSAMYVRIQAGGSAAQSYSISDFRLMGAGAISEAANLTPLQHYFGVDSLEGIESAELAALMARDTDGDGMSDYREILAGFDPHSAASVFAANMTVAAGRNTISWQGVLGKTYAIWRSNDLQAGFLPLIDRIPCTATGLMTRDDNNPATDKPNFYKVVSY